jgi:hypothetical protein
MTTSPHLNPSALGHLVVLKTMDPDINKGWVATQAVMTPANLREYETGVRLGATEPVRERLATALDCPVKAITCWCDRPKGSCRNSYDG